MEGTVTGDLVAFGEEIRISGQVGGMLVTAGESLDIEANGHWHHPGGR